MELQNLYYANSIRNLIMKICAYLPQIPNFGFDAQSVPIILEHSNFYPSVFTPIHILFKVLRKFLKKKTFFRYALTYTLLQKTQTNSAAVKRSFSMLSKLLRKNRNFDFRSVKKHKLMYFNK